MTRELVETTWRKESDTASSAGLEEREKAADNPLAMSLSLASAFSHFPRLFQHKLDVCDPGIFFRVWGTPESALSVSFWPSCLWLGDGDSAVVMEEQVAQWQGLEQTGDAVHCLQRQALEHCCSTFLMLGPFSTVLRAVVTPNHEITSPL